MTRARTLVVTVAAVAVVLALPGAVAARDFTVTSFDGTRIVGHFFPAADLPPTGRAPTVLVGPGWSQPGDNNPESATNEQIGIVGLGPLRAAGYNALTWDPRGFGSSGGTVNANSAALEGRDVQALIDFTARQPEARLDGPGDPRVGMAGASYGGGIQLVTAAIDRRVDAITPTIAWHSLVSSLYKDRTVKSGWGTVLCGLGGGLGLTGGLGAGEFGSLDPNIQSACSDGLATGRIAEPVRSWFASRGPGVELVRRIRAPTLVLQGTVDTLFTPAEAINNFAVLRSTGVPLRMMWFCGGHGVCTTSSGPAGHLEAAILSWLKRHLAGDGSVATGPRFEWLDQSGVWHAAGDYPLASAGALTANGTGSLAFSPADTTSGIGVAATPAVNAVNVAIPAPNGTADTVAAPTLTLTYSGRATTSDVRLFAQIVDTSRNVVAGNQATPLPVLLDGREHTLRRQLEPIALRLGPGSRYRLQIFGASNVYFRQQATGTVDLRAGLSVPIGRDPGPPTPATPGVTPRPTCTPRFTPSTATVRAGRARLTPLVRCGNRKLRVRISLAGGLRWLRVRSGQPVSLRVHPRTRRLVARFTVRGQRGQATVRLRRFSPAG